ncbi:MAG: hypothetical protein LCH26_01550 [Proteobacteria bacterium]|nr:hypothetical protein [Pseudomonadota bacterium]
MEWYHQPTSQLPALPFEETPQVQHFATPSPQPARARSTYSQALAPTPLKGSTLEITQVHPKDLQSVRKASVQKQRTTKKTERKKKPVLLAGKAREYLELANQVLEQNKTREFPDAIEAFYECYANSSALRWQGCLGLAQTYLAMGDHKNAQECLRRIGYSKSCSQEVKEEALTVSLSLAQALLNKKKSNNK